MRRFGIFKRRHKRLEVQERTCVRAVMCFEVGALGVRFPTADVVTRVRGNSLPRPGAPAAFRLGLLRQAVTAGDHGGVCGVQKQQGHHVRGGHLQCENVWGRNSTLRH